MSIDNREFNSLITSDNSLFITRADQDLEARNAVNQRIEGFCAEALKAKIGIIPCILPCYRELIAESSSIGTASTAIDLF